MNQEKTLKVDTAEAVAANPKEAKKEQYASEIRKWKHAHRRVKALFITEDEDLSVLFFRMPTRHQLAAAETLSIDAAGKSDLYKRAERLIVDCLLGGDLTVEQILDDAEVYMAAAQFVLYELVPQKKTSWESC